VSREHAALRHRIWLDKDFTSQDPDAVLLYLFLLSQDDLSYAGTLHLRPRQWARKLPTLGEDRIRAAVDTLAGNRYVLVDEDTEELLIRTFVRNDELWKMPRMLELAIKQASRIESDRLREAFGVELLRIAPLLKRATDKQREHLDEVLTAAKEFTGGVASTLVATPDPALDPPPVADPESTPAEGLAQPPGLGTGAGAPVPRSPQTPRKRGAGPSRTGQSCDRHRRPREGCAACIRAQELASMPPQCNECGPNRMRENEHGQPFHCPTCHPVALARRSPQLRVVGGDG
jgi:hypothetical protein